MQQINVTNSIQSQEPSFVTLEMQFSFLLEKLKFVLDYFMSHIFHFSFDYSFKEWSEKLKFSVVLIIEPAFYRDTIIWLVIKVFFDIINDDNFAQISTKLRQILKINTVFELGMISVQSMRDESLTVKVIQDPISVVFQSCCKHN